MDEPAEGNRWVISTGETNAACTGVAAMSVTKMLLCGTCRPNLTDTATCWKHGMASQATHLRGLFGCPSALHLPNCRTGHHVHDLAAAGGAASVHIAAVPDAVYVEQDSKVCSQRTGTSGNGDQAQVSYMVTHMVCAVCISECVLFRSSPMH